MRLINIVIEKAINALKAGIPIFIHDSSDREDETDIVVRADVIDTKLITWIRKNAGGLICFVTKYEIGKALGIDFLTNILAKSGLECLLKRPRYGDEPAFSIYVNHIGVKTGIRDSDKALTIRRLADIVRLVHKGEHEKAREAFQREFYAPGHIPILLGRIGRRFGHTELSLLLAEMAGIEPALVIAEVLSDDGEAMSVREVERLAASLGSITIEGEDIIREAKRRGLI